MTITPWHWGGFIFCILVLLALDLGVFHKSARLVKFKEALGWTLAWFALAMIFAGAVYRAASPDRSALFITGYIVELSLSMDNVFVIALIFRYFKVPPQFQHRVLFWGILGALLMRGLMIWSGTILVQRFQWLLYGLGAFLIYTGIKMLFAEEAGVHPEKNPVIRLAQRFFPISSQYDGARFFTRWNAKRALTPLAVVLLMVETTDLIFALDSLPAIFGITQDAFIIFTSNVFAILGLRSLYFVLVEALDYFHYLKYGLSAVLVFIGLKMVAKYWHIEVSTNTALGVVATLILTSALCSVLLAQGRKTAKDN